MPLTALTSWRALMFMGKLQEGETLLISGVGGGVATFGLAFAVATGANVYVPGESEDGIERARQMGAKKGQLLTDHAWLKTDGHHTRATDYYPTADRTPHYS